MAAAWAATSLEMQDALRMAAEQILGFAAEQTAGFVGGRGFAWI